MPVLPQLFISFLRDLPLSSAIYHFGKIILFFIQQYHFENGNKYFNLPSSSPGNHRSAASFPCASLAPRPFFSIDFSSFDKILVNLKLQTCFVLPGLLTFFFSLLLLTFFFSSLLLNLLPLFGAGNPWSAAVSPCASPAPRPAALTARPSPAGKL